MARVIPFRSREPSSEVLRLPADQLGGFRVPSDEEIASLYADTPDSRTRRLPLPRRFRRFRRGVLAVALSAVVAIPLVVVATRDSAIPATSATPNPVASAPAPEPAPTISWHRMAGVEFPVSSVDGPSVLTDTASAGFSDTDLGAALAAVHIVFRASAAQGPAVFESALKNQIAGPGAAQLTETVRAEYRGSRDLAGLADGAALPDGAASFVGYKVAPLPDGNRGVQIVEQAPDANGLMQPFAFDVVVTRARGGDGVDDWKVVAPTGGTWSDAFTQLASVPQFLTPFEARTTAGEGS